jgi:hypothetical protein
LTADVGWPQSFASAAAAAHQADPLDTNPRVFIYVAWAMHILRFIYTFQVTCV